MEFKFNCVRVLTCDADGICVLDAKTLPRLRSIDQVMDAIDRMGEASSHAQGLPAVITTSRKLLASDNRLYLKVNENKIIGLLKVGSKKLFIRNDFGEIKEISPLCVLDFYVHESVQRGGFGKALYDRMLTDEKVTPRRLAIDKPSQKFLFFMKKHFGLIKYVPQNNNFVVFSAYFEAEERKSTTEAFGGKRVTSSAAYDLPKSTAKPTSLLQKDQKPIELLNDSSKEGAASRDKHSKSHSLVASPKAPNALGTSKFEDEVKKDSYVKGGVSNTSTGFKGLMTYKDTENPENITITTQKKFGPIDSSKMIERNQKDIEEVQSRIQDLKISLDSKKTGEHLRKTPAASWREEEKKETAKLAYGHDGSKLSMEEIARKTGGDFNVNNNKAVVDYQKKLNTSSNPLWATYNYEIAGKTSSSAYGGHYRFQK